jgi:uncharacterized membrane protein
MQPIGKLRQITINLRSSFWFVPGMMVVAAIGLALGLVEVDQHVNDALRERWPRLFTTEAEGSRAMLSAIAGSMITVAGVVFSITIVALAQASTQYTSRVLRNFMRDRTNQVVLGVFLGVFTYCLVVLRTVSGSDEERFIPSLAVLGGLVLAVVAIGFLILFIHHIATTLQAGEITHSVMHETLAAVDRLFPNALGTEAEAPSALTDQAVAELEWQPVPARRSGYVQSVEAGALIEFAIEHRTVVRMECGVGEFIAEGRPIVSLALMQPPDRNLVKRLNGLYAVDSYRTTDQDAAYGLRQLVDVALKALSPGINDTTTAVTALDYLSVILQRLADREIGSPYRSEDSRLRVIARGPTFAHLVELAFGQILENAEGNTSVLVRMLRVIEEVAAVTPSRARRQRLLERVDVIEEVALRGAKSVHARATIEAHIRSARAMCRAGPHE